MNIGTLFSRHAKYRPNHLAVAPDGSVWINGTALDEEYVRTRALWEPMYEATQIKGDGETHPFLSPNDEFADYETWDKANLDGTEVKTNDMFRWEYSREALKTGLALSESSGFNPYVLGAIGSSDGHNGSSATEEANYTGKIGIADHTPHRRMVEPLSEALPTSAMSAWGAAGLAGVWAEENTRDAIFQAMKRRETYATSGTRINLRFFAGWDDFAAEDEQEAPEAP